MDTRTPPPSYAPDKLGAPHPGVYDTMTSYAEAAGTLGTAAQPNAGTVPPRVVLVATPAARDLFLDAPVPSVQCPFCGAVGTTNVDYAAGRLTWLTCVGLAFVGLVAGCCLVPFCVRGLKDARHSCAHCGHVIAIYKRL